MSAGRRASPGPERVEEVLEAAAELSQARGRVERAAALERLVDRARAALRGEGDDVGVADGPRAGDALRLLFVGREAVLERVTAQVERALGAAQPVLLEGEPGTGKTLVAVALHEGGGVARRGALQRVAPPVTAEALVRAGRAAGGSLLVEEVAALSRRAQEELLRLLRAPPARRGPRVLATTRHDLDAAVAAGWFVPELRDRLHVLRLRLPPLREHRGAIPALLQRLLGASSEGEPPAVTPDALAALCAHDWPGNARELELAARVLRDWAASAPIDAAHAQRFLAQLAMAAPGASSAVGASGAARAEPTLEAQERATIAERLARHAWRQVETARSLGIDRKTLYRKIRQYGLEP